MKIIKTTLLTLACTIVAFLLRNAADVAIAANRTRSIVAKTMAENKMELGLSDFGAYRLQELLMIEDPAFYTHRSVDFTIPWSGHTRAKSGMRRRGTGQWRTDRLTLPGYT